MAKKPSVTRESQISATEEAIKDSISRDIDGVLSASRIFSDEDFKSNLTETLRRVEEKIWSCRGLESGFEGFTSIVSE